jgi:hypothetical protein
MFGFRKCRKGSALLVVVAVLAVMSSIMAFGTAKLTQASFNALSSNKKGVQALQLAESKAKILRLGGYANAAAQAKTQVSSTGFYDEITLGSVTTSGTVSTRTATVNVYGPGDTTARVALPVLLSTAESVTIPSGTICIWYSSSSSIPSGWALCDGNNGTPDLRSRFIYGAGADGSSKSTLGTGWSSGQADGITGHWDWLAQGGEECHVISLAEMPNHNHNFWTASWQGIGDDAYSITAAGGERSLQNSNGHRNHIVLTTAVGSNAAMSLFPRFRALCYIMKL